MKFTEKGYVRLHIAWQTTSGSSSQKDASINQDNHHIDDGDNNLAAAIVEEEERDLFEDVQEFSDTLVSPTKKENHHLISEYYKKFITKSELYQLNLTKSYWNHYEILTSVLPERSKGILKIRVLDSGCGMTPDSQSKLFQKFSQVSSIQGQRKVGTGLGLWICKELANRLDGDITTRSNVGVGSVFELAIRARVLHIHKKSRHHHRQALDQGGKSSPSDYLSNKGDQIC